MSDRPEKIISIEEIIELEELNQEEDLLQIAELEEQEEEHVYNTNYKPYAFEEYMSLIKKKYGIDDSIDYYDILDKLQQYSIVKNRYLKPKIRFKADEMINFVLTYQDQVKKGEEPDDLLCYVIYNSYLPSVLKISNRYIGYGIVYKKRGANEADYYQEAFIILMKCMSRFAVLEGRYSSFSSYYQGEIKNHFIETTRSKYFELMKIPAREYREQRKETSESIDQKPVHVKVKEQMCHALTSTYNKNLHVIEDEIIEQMDAMHDLVAELYLEAKMTPTEIIILLMVNGIGTDQYNMNNVSNIFRVSNSTISKKYRIAKNKIENHPKFKAYADSLIEE